MTVLLMRLAGPMQSWGTQSRFTNRDTGREPSKSGVVGLLCAALGCCRDDDEIVAELASLRMGVRVDREGRVARDYHTAGGGRLPDGSRYGVIKASGRGKDAVVSNRYYLADAEFIVGLEGDRSILERCGAALASPVWPLFLGRKSFVPGLPVRILSGLRDGRLEDVLTHYPWRARYRKRRPREPLRMVLETDDPEAKVRMDQPLTFKYEAYRKYDLRYVVTKWVAPDDVPVEEGLLCTSPG